MADQKPKKRDTWSRLGGEKDLPEQEAARAAFAKKAHKAIPGIVKAHKAWMVAMLRGDNLDRETGLAILRALCHVDIDEMIATHDRRFDKPILQLERYLGDKLGEHGSDVLAGRTLPPPIYRTEAREAILPLISAAHELCSTILDIATQHTHTVMPGYTHLSHAQPMTYGHYLLGFHDAIARAAHEIEAAYAATNLCNMGCGALAGTSFNINRQLLADLLGFDGVLEHSNDCVAATDFAITLVAALTNLFIPISRVANELDVWTTFEANMLEVSDRIGATSSMMPQKKNATICEHLRYALGTVMGYYNELACGAHNTSYGDTMDVMFIYWKVPEIARKGVWGCERMATLLKNLSVHEDVMLRHASQGFSTVSELAAVLLREKGVAWRVAHAIVAGVVRALDQAGKTAADITPEIIDESAVAVTGEPLGLSAQSIQAAIDPVRFVEAMTSQGGTAPDETARMIKQRHKTLATDAERQVQRRNRLLTADGQLDTAVNELLNK
jgi:argininosuccinate lyase